ncbi:hypothetical protein niasHT_003249 [Heterodera trifolii]|uniref:Uncharacterized protein n=1 Tax=Heterodera trifolii TaxID=157864 RepID=A0ABD2LS38_9BILA
MYTTTTTTTTPTPAPVVATAEGITFHACLRGRKSTKQFVLTGNQCLFNAIGCYFVFCYDVKLGTQHFAEWGCDPAPINKTYEGCRPMYPDGYEDKNVWKCHCELCDIKSREMCNEHHGFEEFYKKYNSTKK